MIRDEPNLGTLAKRFTDEQAARKFLEDLRWPKGPECPRCGGGAKAYKLQGRTTREGLYKCAVCLRPFTVTMGTMLEGTHIPLRKWLLSYHLLCLAQQGVTAPQLQRMLKISYHAAQYMLQRICRGPKVPERLYRAGIIAAPGVRIKFSFVHTIRTVVENADLPTGTSYRKPEAVREGIKRTFKTAFASARHDLVKSFVP
ncbi:MAG: transposase [Acidobacteriales bacterium]|nr:transposase [Terriglobales bacterium]